MVRLRKNYHKPMVSVSTYVIMLKNMLDIYVKLKKYYPHILLIALVFFAFFLRFYRLSDFPPALYQDETAIGYNAYLIIQKGVDEYGKSFPLYFQSFGDYKLPVYIYLSALSIKIFGYSAFSIRFPSAFFGSLSVAVLFFLTYSLTKKKSLNFVAAFLLAINPWHLQFSRSGFEVNVALFFSLLGTIFFLATCKNRRSYLLIPSVLSFALSLYSYNVTRLLVPFFIGALLYSNRSPLKKINRYYILFVTAFLIVLFFPFLITLFNASGIYSAQSNLVTSADIRANNIELRSYLGTLPAWYTKIMFNNYVYLIYAYMENLARTISGSFFFVQGPSELTQGIGTTGPFYLFQLPFFIYGIVFYFKKTS